METTPNVPGSYGDWFRNPPSDVEGWLPSITARAFHACLAAQEQHNVVGSIAEIGVYHGKTFIGLALSARTDERVVAVDVFEFGDKNFRPDFDANVRRYVPDALHQRLVVAPTSSGKIYHPEWRTLLDRPARLVHIDGAHLRKYVLYDFSLAASYLAHGGLVVFDDFCSEYFPGVTTAIIDGLRANPHVRPIAVIPRIHPLRQQSAKLICGLRGGLAIYEQALLDAYPDLWHTRREFIYDNILVFVEPGQIGPGDTE
jgi:methyltransferase family protein